MFFSFSTTFESFSAVLNLHFMGSNLISIGYEQSINALIALVSAAHTALFVRAALMDALIY